MAALSNARHEAFVQKLITGATQRQAYLAAFPQAKNCTGDAIDKKASALFKRTEVRGRYEEIKEQQKQDALLTRYKKRLILAQIATDESEDASDRIKAVDIDNKMEGCYVEKRELSGCVNTNPFTGLTTEELRQLINDG